MQRVLARASGTAWYQFGTSRDLGTSFGISQKRRRYQLRKIVLLFEKVKPPLLVCPDLSYMIFKKLIFGSVMNLVNVAFGGMRMKTACA
jgi:hypothetical protein